MRECVCVCIYTDIESVFIYMHAHVNSTYVHVCHKPAGPPLCTRVASGDFERTPVPLSLGDMGLYVCRYVSMYDVCNGRMDGWMDVYTYI